jgi:hypothetical protein
MGLGVSFANSVALYQSELYSELFPEEKCRFGNVIYVDAILGDRNASLLQMRQKMLSRDDLSAAVFIGGMEGVLEEYRIVSELHPGFTTLAIPAPGGAARELAERICKLSFADTQDVNLARIFHVQLDLAQNEPRTL